MTKGDEFGYSIATFPNFPNIYLVTSTYNLEEPNLVRFPFSLTTQARQPSGVRYFEPGGFGEFEDSPVGADVGWLIKPSIFDQMDGLSFLGIMVVPQVLPDVKYTTRRCRYIRLEAPKKQSGC